MVLPSTKLGYTLGVKEIETLYLQEKDKKQVPSKVDVLEWQEKSG